MIPLTLAVQFLMDSEINPATFFLVNVSYFGIVLIVTFVPIHQT